MKRLRIVAAAIIVVLIGAQCIRPERNVSARPPGAADTGERALPDDVRRVLQISCFDCHSNNTRYPWYASIQPFGWLLASHIRDGKRNLNFDEFSSYPVRRKFVKFRQIEEQIAGNEMPLGSYLLIHRDAVLSEEQKSLVISWTRSMRDSLKLRFPADSLERRPRQNTAPPVN